MKLKHLSFISAFIFLILSLFGCSSEEMLYKHEVIKGPQVTQSEAKKVAKDKVHISKINKIEIRTLNKWEFDNILSEDAKKLTPVYFVIHGIDKNQKEMTVYVNSNDKKIFYSKH